MKQYITQNWNKHYHNLFLVFYVNNLYILFLYFFLIHSLHLF